MKKIIVINILFLFLVLQPFIIKSQPPKLLNFGNSCYVNALIQALNATTPLIKTLPELNFYTNKGIAFKNLIEKIQKGKQHKINASLLQFYIAITDFNVHEEEKEDEKTIQKSLQALNDKIKKLEHDISETENKIARTTDKNEKLYLESKISDQKYQLEKKKLTKELISTLKKSPEYIETLLKKVNAFAQQDAGRYLDNFLNEIKSESDQETKMNKIFFYSFFVNESREKTIKNDVCVTPVPTILSDVYQVEYEKKLGKIVFPENIKFAQSLNECLDKYFADYTITKPSEVFIFQLNRFIYGVEKGSLLAPAEIKLSKNINIPHSLDLTKYTNDKSKKIKYKLYAAINHLGSSTSSGHYIAYLKHNNQWYLCNDSTILSKSKKDIKHAINNDGYILFYQRIEESAQEAPLSKKEQEAKEKKRQEMQEALQKEAERLEASRKALQEKLKEKEEAKKRAEVQASIELAKKIAEEEKQAEEQRKKRLEEQEKAGLAEAQRLEKEIQKLRREEEELLRLRRLEEERLRRQEEEQRTRERALQERKRIQEKEEKELADLRKQEEQRIKRIQEQQKEEAEKREREKQQEERRKEELRRHQEINRRKLELEKKKKEEERKRAAAKSPVNTAQLKAQLENLKRALTTLIRLIK